MSVCSIVCLWVHIRIDTLWDSYSAFANTDGGCILLGVKEREDHSLYVAGLKDAEKMKKDFWNTIIHAGDKMAINDGIIDKMADIVIYLETHPQSTSSAIAKLIDLQISSAKNYLKRLIELGFIVAHGANKNRTYSKK